MREPAVAKTAVADADRWADGSPGAISRSVSQWRQLVDEVEAGYSWSAPELSNDLGCRHELARAWPELPAAVRTAWEPELRELDDRFRVATVPWSEHGGGVWWLDRVPRLIEVEAGRPCDERGWPQGWEMMPFAKPDAVRVSSS